MNKALSTLILIGLLLYMPAYSWAQQKKEKASLLEQKLKEVNTLKNTNADSAFLVVSNLIKSAHLAQLPVQEAKGFLIKGVILYNKDQNKEAFALFNQALILFQKAGDKLGIAKAYNNLGGASGALNDPEKALHYQKKALEIRTLINDPLLSSTYNMIGNIYLEQGNYPMAVENYLKGLPISEKNNDKYVQSSLLNNIAQVYWKQSRYNEAFDYTSKCLNLEKQEKDYKGMAGSYNNLAGIRLDQGNFEDAFNYSKEAVKYAEKVNFTKELARAYSVMGEMAYRKDNYRDAVNYSLIALNQRRKIGRDRETATSLIKLSEAYTALKEYDEAEKLCLEGLKLSEKNSLLKQKESFYRILGDIYNKKGDWKNAYANSINHDITKDSIFNESNSKIIFDLQTKYETSKKQNQIVVLNKENNIKTLQLENKELEIGKNRYLITQQKQALTIGDLQLKNAAQKLQNQQLDADKKDQNIKMLNNQYKIQKLELANRNFLIAIILIVVAAGAGIFYALYNRYKVKQKALLQSEIFKQQEIATKSVFEGEQKERIRIARDLHDSIGQMLSVVKMNVSTLQHQFPENNTTSNTLELVDKTITEVRAISHNLLPEALNFGLFAALEDMTDKINAAGDAQVILSIPDVARKHQFARQNELSIYRIVQEVLGNMVKHAEATLINLEVITSDSGLKIVIKDNGKGFNPDQIKTSKGLGWKNIFARVNLMDGTMQVHSEKLTGTEIEITIPK